MAKPLGVNFDGHPGNTHAGASRSAPAEFQVTIASTAPAGYAVSNKFGASAQNSGNECDAKRFGSLRRATGV